MYFSPKLKTVYIHIPKTGGLSMMDYLQSMKPNEGRRRRRHEQGYQIADFLRRFPGKFPGYNTDWFWWATIRHPIERWQSQVRMTQAQRGTRNEKKTITDWSERGIYEYFDSFRNRVDMPVNGALQSQMAFLRGVDWPIYLVDINNPLLPTIIERQFGRPFTEHVNRTHRDTFEADPEITHKIRTRAYYKEDIQLYRAVSECSDWFKYDPIEFRRQRKNYSDS